MDFEEFKELDAETWASCPQFYEETFVFINESSCCLTWVQWENAELLHKFSEGDSNGDFVIEVYWAKKL